MDKFSKEIAELEALEQLEMENKEPTEAQIKKMRLWSDFNDDKHRAYKYQRFGRWHLCCDSVVVDGDKCPKCGEDKGGWRWEKGCQSWVDIKETCTCSPHIHTHCEECGSTIVVMKDYQDGDPILCPYCRGNYWTRPEVL